MFVNYTTQGKCQQNNGLELNNHNTSTTTCPTAGNTTSIGKGADLEVPGCVDTMKKI